jgi:hypothetical protein
MLFGPSEEFPGDVPDLQGIWEEALRSGNRLEIEAALQRLEKAPVGVWARLLQKAFDCGQVAIVTDAMVPERLVDAMADGDFQLAQTWVEHLVKENQTLRLADFAFRLLRRSVEIDQMAAGGLYATLAHAIAFSHPETAILLAERRIPSVPDHWTINLMKNRIVVGQILDRLPPDLRAIWVKHLDETDASSTLDPSGIEPLIHRTRGVLGAKSRAFSRLAQFGPTPLRHACDAEHQNRARLRSSRPHHRGPDHSPEPPAGFRVLPFLQVLISLLAIAGILYMLHLVARSEVQKLKEAYQPKSAVSMTERKPGDLLPMAIRPLYAALGEKGVGALEEILETVPNPERDRTRRLLLLTRAQETDLSPTERDHLRDLARRSLDLGDQERIDGYLADSLEVRRTGRASE